MLRIVPTRAVRNVWPPRRNGGRNATRADHVTNVLFVCDEPADAQPCLAELARAHFDVSADFALDVAGYVERLPAAFDVVVSCGSTDTDTPLRALDLLQKHAPDIPFILVSPAAQRGLADLFLANGAFDWVDRSQLDLLPASVAVALESRSARDESDRAATALKGSQALHRALVDNPTYGVCRFDFEGRLLDVNQVLLDMLGYDSREELLQRNLATDLTLDPFLGMQLLDTYRRTGQVAGQDAEWKRKDTSPLIVRLGGRHVGDESEASCELIAYDVTADRAQEVHLQHLAFTDPLTGIANYRHLRQAIEAETHRSQRTRRPFAILLLDLDALKAINDRFGHLAGNRALCRVAAALRRCCRSMDLPGRCGGDEFTVMLPETGAREAGLIGRRICTTLVRDAEEPPISVSVGIAVYPHDGASFDALLQSADCALYLIKSELGRMRVTSPGAAASGPAVASRRGRTDRGGRRSARRQTT